jgi:hypothetical protein
MSFREWLLAPILARIEFLMAKNFADLTASVAANTAATTAAVAAFATASNEDFTAPVAAIDANTAKLNALASSGTTPPASPLSASPANVALSAATPSAVVNLAELNGAANTFSAVVVPSAAGAPAIATVSPASGPGPFTVELAAAGVTGSASIAFTDAQGNVANVAVVAS